MSTVELPLRPRLNPKLRMRHDPVRQAHVLLMAEKVVVLNQSAAEILALCDGTRTASDVVQTLTERYPNDRVASDVLEFLRAAHARGWLM